MQPLKAILDIINGIIESPNKILIISWLFLGIIVWYLYTENVSLQLKLDGIAITNQSNINKANENCEDQIKINREKFQDQLDSFTNRANKNKDSTALYFYNELSKANQRITEKIEKIR